MPIYDVTRMYKLEHTIKGVEAKNEEDALEVSYKEAFGEEPEEA